MFAALKCIMRHHRASLSLFMHSDPCQCVASITYVSYIDLLSTLSPLKVYITERFGEKFSLPFKGNFSLFRLRSTWNSENSSEIFANSENIASSFHYSSAQSFCSNTVHPMRKAQMIVHWPGLNNGSQLLSFIKWTKSAHQ